MTTRWLLTDKGDQDARRVADRHYTRQTPGALQFTRNGQNLVFITADLRAVWVTFRPTPGKATRTDGLDAWECALFRNEGPCLSSELIAEAVWLSVACWGPFPVDGLITFVRPEKVRSTNPGFCYLKAGWVRVGRSSDDDLPMFRAPPVPYVPPLAWWAWRSRRGGLFRRTVEQWAHCWPTPTEVAA